MNKFYIIANLKMNKSFEESKKYLKSLQNKVKSSKCKIVLCPSNISLAHFNKNIHEMELGIQDIDYRNEGQGTGSISASQIKDICDYVLIGHSERRETFSEDHKLLNKKLKSSWKNNLKTIFCVGENINIRNKGSKAVEDYIVKQLVNSLEPDSDWKNLIVAYEPIWAIGTGKPADTLQIKDVLEVIKLTLSQLSNNINIPILYGGSINEKNFQEYKNKKNIDGLLIGSASLDPDILSNIINNI
ncbi:MAG: triose-phosphate isomerase [Dehalococcoidia bacterium]|jgi:triosephosphate isomerase (TIM)|nr:triose-phosphate isomerase [Dehalococcoidia bacterium]